MRERHWYEHTVVPQTLKENATPHMAIGNITVTQLIESPGAKMLLQNYFIEK